MTEIIEEMKNIHIASSELEKIALQIKVLRECYITLHNSIISRQSSIENDNLKRIEKLSKFVEEQVKELIDVKLDKITLILPERFNVLMGTLEFLAKKMHKIEERLEKIENDRHKEFTLSVTIDENNSKEVNINDWHYEIMGLLAEPYRTIIVHRYINSNKKTLKQIANLIGIKSQESVRQKENRALGILRNKKHFEVVNKLPECNLRRAIFGES